MKQITKIQSTRKHDITIEEVKSLPMFADFSEEQASEVIRVIKVFVEIVLDNYKKEHFDVD